MANIKSNEKSIRKNARRCAQNKIVRTKYKNDIKRVVVSNSAEHLSKLYRDIDSAVSKKNITKNKANRLKSNITKRVNKAKKV